MDRFEELIDKIKDKSDTVKISMLNESIERELCLSDGETDTGYIDKCTDMICEIKAIPFLPLSQNEICEKTVEIFDLYKERRLRKRVLKVRAGFKTAFKVLAAAIALAFLMGCALYAVNKDAFYKLLNEFGYSSVEDLPRGNTDLGDKTIKRSAKQYSAANAAELYDKSGEAVYYPAELPEGYALEQIYYLIFEDETKISFDIMPRGDITADATDLYKADKTAFDAMEKYEHGGIIFYLDALETGESGDKVIVYSALFDDGDMQYTVTAKTRETLMFVVDHIVKQEKK